MASPHPPPRILVEFGAQSPLRVHEASSHHGDDDDDEWDLVSSERRHPNNNTSSSRSACGSSARAAAVWVPTTGSVRSIRTDDFGSSTTTTRSQHRFHGGGGSSSGGGSPAVPPPHRSAVRSIPPPQYPLHRTHSNSTIDSNDVVSHDCVGPAGKGVLGVDYVEHLILPTDTLQGICLAYKISSTRLRQANHFSGHSLLLAPKKLVIPISAKALKSGFLRVQDTNAKEYKLYSFLAEFPKLGITEAKAYLELSDWDLPSALQSAKEDVEWEQEDGTTLDPEQRQQQQQQPGTLKSGEIRITSAPSGAGLQALGAGIRSSSHNNSSTISATTMTRGPQRLPLAKASSPVYASYFPGSSLLRRMVSPTNAAAAPDQDRAQDDDETGKDPQHQQQPKDDVASEANNNNNHNNKARIVYAPLPAIATKSVQPQDVYQASSQHAHYGVELQPVVSHQHPNRPPLDTHTNMPTNAATTLPSSGSTVVATVSSPSPLSLTMVPSPTRKQSPPQPQSLVSASVTTSTTTASTPASVSTTSPEEQSPSQSQPMHPLC